MSAWLSLNVTTMLSLSRQAVEVSQTLYPIFTATTDNISLFFHIRAKLKKNLICFHFWFVKSIDKTVLKFVIAYQ